MTEAVVPNSLPAIRAAKAYHMKALEALNAAETVILSFDPYADLGRYSGKKPAHALAEFLEGCGGQATKSECLDALLRGGCDLGAIPKGNLTRIITTNRERFAVRGERVFLVSQKAAA